MMSEWVADGMVRNSSTRRMGRAEDRCENCSSVVVVGMGSMIFSRL